MVFLFFSILWLDPKKPILCYYQEEEDSQVSLPANRPSAAVMDVSENLRSKIYSVFCKLGKGQLTTIFKGRIKSNETLFVTGCRIQHV